MGGEVPVIGQKWSTQSRPPTVGNYFEDLRKPSPANLESQEERTLQITGCTREADHKLPPVPAQVSTQHRAHQSVNPWRSQHSKPSTVTVDARLLSAPYYPSLKSIFSP